ncbi:PAS domain S-box protein [Devosia sp. A8/3-2]|nr:PAS domain S-box protein [Devosia sp. A8/3-2]
MDTKSDFVIAARLAAIIDSSFDAIISKDLNSVITSWNIAAQRMFGYTSREAVGRSILMLIPEHLRSEETDIISRIRNGERVESYDTTRLRKDGSTIYVSITVSPIKDADGTIIGASKIARDVSRARESEQRIRLLLREVNHRMKNQFAVILSIIRESSNRAFGQGFRGTGAGPHHGPFPLA